MLSPQRVQHAHVGLCANPSTEVRHRRVVEAHHDVVRVDGVPKTRELQAAAVPNHGARFKAKPADGVVVGCWKL